MLTAPRPHGSRNAATFYFKFFPMRRAKSILLSTSHHLKYFLLLLFFTSSFSVDAQLVCPPNIDFELGNTTNWNTYIGTCCPLTTATLTATPVANRHTITSGTGVDMYGGFPIVSPGGTYSLKLGNNSTGAQAEKVRYYVHVPATATNYSIHYKYAVVFQDPGHILSNQPRFEVNAFDSATGTPLPCAQYTYVSSVGLPGFLTSPLATVYNIIYYKPWTTESINMSGWAGSTIVVDFATGDCAQGGHFGYAYLDAQCGLFTASVVACDSSTPVTLTAPPGFATYQWFDSATFSTSYGTTQIVTVPFPAAGTSMTYAVILTPYAGFGCPDTLYVNVDPSTIILGSGPVAGPITGPSTVCLGGSIVLSCSPVGGTWSSSSPGVASIGSTGLVTGISAGTTTISYTVSNSCGTDVATKVIRLDTVSTGPIDGSTSVCEGSSVTLTCLPSGGTWSSSPAGIVSIASSGLASATVTGVSPGVTTITYTAGSSSGCGGGIATMSFTVNPLPSAITGNVPFCIGTTFTLGNPVPGGTWSCTPSSIATISSGGAITGIATGTAVVTYVTTCGTAMVVVTVNPVLGPITGDSTVCVGITSALSNIVPGGTWSCVPTSVATISTTGLVTGVAPGTAIVSYVTICGTVSTIITINPLPTVGTISSLPLLCPTFTGTLTCTPPGGTWTSSSPTIATISTVGVVTAVAGGTTTISYTYSDGTCSNTATRVVSVSAVTPPGTIGGPSTVCQGSSIALNCPPTGGSWTSSTPAVATVTSVTGIVIGVSAGTTTITYSKVYTCGTIISTKVVTVNASGTVTLTGPNTVCAGSSITLTSTATGGTWVSGNTTVATVGTGGVVLGLSPGTTVITYSVTSSCGTGTGTKTITVNTTPATGTITGASVVCVGSTIPHSGTPTGGTWASSTPGVGTISTTGSVTGLSGGTTTISYTLTNTCGTTSATSVITVNPSPGAITGNTPICVGSSITLGNTAAGGTWSCAPATVATISPTGVVSGITVGTATVSYVTTCGTVSAIITVNASPGPITGNVPFCMGSTITLGNSLAGGTWSITPSSVATIGSTGIVTGIAAGTATVSYVTTCGTVNTVVTVNGAPGAITGNVILCVSMSTLLGNPMPGGTWSIVPVSVATISSSGWITGVAPGNATVSYTTPCGIVTAVITVNPTSAPITGNTPICVGGTLTLSIAMLGGTWICAPVSVATISSTGVVTGVGVGTATVSYLSYCGPILVVATTIVTVNPAPGPITGNTPVCQSSTITLSNTSSGGTWSSTPTSIATISSTGVVTGVAAGTATVSYVTTCGTVATIVTVIALPGAITGNVPFCEGSSLTLSNSLAGGTWNCTPATVATISSTGTVSGISAGTATVSYVTNCGTVSAIVTVNPAPGPITGNTPVCQSSTITLSNTASGGSWSCTPTSIATISSTGVVTGVAAGTATVSYVTTCGTVATIVTVIALPGAITDNIPFCEGSSLTLSNSLAGGTWSCAPATVATISSTGIVSGISASTATVSYATTCGTVSTIITVNPLPGSITGNTPFCQGSSITLSNAVAGGTWIITPLSVAAISASGLVTGVAAGTATVSYVTTCGTVSTIVTVIATPDAITGNTPFCEGTSITLVNALTGGAWSCSPTTIATIDVTGTVTGLTTGTATVSYATTCGTVSIIVTVTPLPGAIIGNAPFCQGTSITLSNPLAGGTWSCVPTSVATISTTGIATGLIAGTATISYVTTCGTVTTVITVTPLPGAIAGTSPFCQGSTITLTNSLAGGTWSCAPTSIATISTSGIVTGVATGTATVSYTTTCGTVSTVVTVTALPGAITGNVPFCQGSSISLSNSLGGGTWSCSPASIAIISASGVVSGVGGGTATVSYVPTCGTVTTIVTVIPLPGPITGNTPVCQGSTITLSNSLSGGTWSCIPVTVATISTLGSVSAVSAGTATVSYTTACGIVGVIVTVVPLPGPITGNVPICQGSTMLLSNSVAGGTWSCTPASIATITSAGNVTGITGGTATVSYTTTCGSVSTVITVNPLPGPIGGNAPICAGSTLTLTNAIAGGTWSSSSPSIATVGSTGVVTGATAGTASILYSNSCGTASVVVTVNPLPGPITGNNPFCIGTTITLGNSVAGGAWSCAPASVATISGTGVVTAVGAGTATIFYSTSCGTVSAIVTVYPTPGSITGNSPLCVGNTLALGNSLPGGTWSIAPSTIATISPSGVVTGVAPGTAIVSYVTICGTVTAIIIVTPLPGAITGNVPFCQGHTITLSNPVAGGAWSIAPVSVATIGSTGVVTGISPGTATVSYAVGFCRTYTVVTVNPSPNVGFSFANPICGGPRGSITLTGLYPGITYTVHCTSTTTVTTSATSDGYGNIVIGDLVSGTYTLSVTNSYGCTSNFIGPVILTDVGVPVAPAATANSICEGDTLKLNISPTVPGVIYHWSGPDGFSTTTTNPYIYPARPGNDGTYSVVATLGLCTSGTTTIPVTVHPEPKVTGITWGGPGSCYGSDGWIALAGLSAGAPYTVNYLFNSTPNTATITADGSGVLRITGLSSGTYSGFVLISSFGCVSKPVGPVTLIFGGKPPKPVIDHNYPCIGQTLLLNANDAMPGGTYTWAYPDGGGASIKNPSRHNVQTSQQGIYTVTYTVADCSTSDTATINFYLPAVLYDVTQNQTIKYGTTIQLNASGAIFYRWIPNDGTLNNPNINNPLATPVDSTTYTVYGSNGGGCIDSAKVTILVDDDIDEYVPSAFTPNGDGLNDIFRIRNMRTQKLVEFSIYNRYGERIYYNGYEKDAGWDGMYNGIPQDMGVYFYYIIVGLRNGVNRIHKGDVTLIR